tara:strand:- start:6493 stop:6624 length:132 start_codon:yes stop_codon:yes gene_type:complete
MSKYDYMRELLREAYPAYNKEMVEQVMRRIEKIRDTERKKQSS